MTQNYPARHRRVLHKTPLRAISVIRIQMDRDKYKKSKCHMN